MSKFWGLTVNVGKRFKQQVQEPFCISGAAVEPTDSVSGQYDEKPIQLYLHEDNSDHLLCSLYPKQGVYQVPLDVRIGSGETIGFYLKGGSQKTKVHLTGYTLPRGTSASPQLAVPFKGQRKSILVTEPRSGDKDQKKRVSIVENEAYGEVESSDEENTTPSRNLDALHGDIRKNIFNGYTDDVMQDSDDDDDDDDDEEEDENGNPQGLKGRSNEDNDSDDDDDDDDEDYMDEDEKQELAQLGAKGKYDPKTGAKLLEGEDSDSDLELLDDEDDDDDDDDDDEEDSDSEDEKEVSVSKQSPKKETTPKKSDVKKESGTPQKQKPGTPNKSNANESSATPKTPENKNLKLKTPSSAGHTPMKTLTKGGVLVNEMKIGTGQVAKSGKMVTVYYRGRLKTNNKEFDATTGGPGFKFRLGKGEVIKGWDLGVEGMKVGGKRRLTIPAQLAYGKRGAPPDIPPNSTLVFEVELRNVS